MKKRYLAFTLALVAALLTLTGCSKKLEYESEAGDTPVKIVYEDSKHKNATIIDGEDEYKVEKKDHDIIITYPNGSVLSYIWDKDISLWDISLDGPISGYIAGDDLVFALNTAK